MVTKDRRLIPRIELFEEELRIVRWLKDIYDVTILVYEANKDSFNSEGIITLFISISRSFRV